MFNRELREMSFVPRWVIARRLRDQYLAEHSYFVAVYAEQIARYIEWDGDYALLLSRALWHDVPETITGDMPGPAKRFMKVGPCPAVAEEIGRRYGPRYGELASSTEHPDITAILKVADCVDELFWLATEQNLGNRSLRLVVQDAQERIRRAMTMLPTSTFVSNSLLELILAEANREDSEVVTG